MIKMKGRQGRPLIEIAFASLLVSATPVFAVQLHSHPAPPLPPPTIAPAFVECPNTPIDVPYALNGRRLNLLHYNSLIYDITSPSASGNIAYQALSKMVKAIAQIWEKSPTPTFSDGKLDSRVRLILNDMYHELDVRSDNWPKNISDVEKYNSSSINNLNEVNYINQYIEFKERDIEKMWSLLILEWALNRQKMANIYNKKNSDDPTKIYIRQIFLQEKMKLIKMKIQDIERQNLLSHYIRKMEILSHIYYLSVIDQNNCFDQCKNALIIVNAYISNVIKSDVSSVRSYKDINVIDSKFRYEVSRYRFYIFVIRNATYIYKKHTNNNVNVDLSLINDLKNNDLYSNAMCDCIHH